MKIAIIGAGSVGGTLGLRWAATGHEVRFAARDPRSDSVRAALAAAPGATAAPVVDTVAWSDVAVLAAPWNAAEAAVASAGDFGARPLLDATNPIGPGFALAVGHTTSGGEQVQAWAPTAKVVKIFNTVGWEVMAEPRFPGGPAVMMYCGDDEGAKALAAGLAADLGFEPVDLGPLTEARLVEPYAMVWIKLAVARGMGRGWALGVLRR